MTDNERKETISALRQLLAMCDFVDQYGDSIDADPYFNAVETAIESLNETRWIPVSERLPDLCEVVLYSINGEATYAGYRTDRDYSGGVVEPYWSDLEDGIEVFPNAWMPLPEPYREDGEE